MKILMTVTVILLVILGVSSGISKIMLLPQEIQFFGGAGLSNIQIVWFGVVQCIGALLMILRWTRIVGAVILALTFVLSTVLILVTGAIGFGMFSLLPIILIWVVAKDQLIGD